MNDRRLSRKLCLIYALNIADWICTVTLLRIGGFYEANPLMRPLIGEPLSGLIVKGLLPAVLLVLVSRLSRRLETWESLLLNRFISFVLALYSVLCTVHIMNFIVCRIVG